MSITLNELRNQEENPINTMPENPNAITPMEKERPPIDLNELEGANQPLPLSYLDEKKAEIAAKLAESEEQAAEYFRNKAKLAAEAIDDEDTKSMINEPSSETKKPKNKPVKSSLKNPIFTDDDEISTDDDISQYIVTDDDEDAMPSDDGNRLKKEMHDSFNKIGYSQSNGDIDLTKFTIIDKPKSIYDSIDSLASLDTSTCADWYLPNSGFGITIDRMKAVEIELMNPRSSNQNNNANSLKMYKAIYKHCIMANKPEFEIWMKSINATDLDSLFYCVYLSSFPDNNPIVRQCDDGNCGHEFVEVADSKLIPVFKDDKSKEKFYSRLEAYDGTWSDASYREYGVQQISSKYAIKLRQPTIFEIEIELKYGNDKFKEEYEDTISYILFIDEVYEINYNTKQLVPLNYKQFSKDDKATYVSKVKAYSHFIRSLDTKGLSILDKVISDGEDDSITYKYAESKCPKCGKEIKSSEMNMRSIVFFRHRMEATINS